jgi:hypothetical protein
VLPLSVKIWASVRVPELTPETRTTEPTSTTKLVTEDAQVEILISFNAESMVDQETMIRALKLMSDVLENHTRDHLSESQAKNLL